MSRVLTWFVIPLFLGAAVVASLALLLFIESSRAQEVPPLSWTCPMHPDVIEGEKGVCPICSMELVATRLDLAWTCPLHAVIAEKEPGQCPICKRALIRVTVALSWTCPMHPEIDRVDPGVCPVCNMTLVEKTSQRAHGDHNPRHGGLFFMAPDNWHHLEGSYPEPGIFRVHVYDDYTKPMSVRTVEGRAVTREVFDASTRETRELTAFPLLPAADGSYLEARLGTTLPATVTAKIRFGPDGPEHRFDFEFADYTKEPDPGTEIGAGMTMQLDAAVPEKAEDIVTELGIRSQRLQQLIGRGALNEVYSPALEAKDLALALDGQTSGLTEDRRRSVALAIKRVVRSGWLLDTYGDLGNRQKVLEAYAILSEAVAEIESAYGVRK